MPSQLPSVVSQSAGCSGMRSPAWHAFAIHWACVTRRLLYMKAQLRRQGAAPPHLYRQMLWMHMPARTVMMGTDAHEAASHETCSNSAKQHAFGSLLTEPPAAMVSNPGFLCMSKSPSGLRPQLAGPCCRRRRRLSLQAAALDLVLLPVRPAACNAAVTH